MTSRQRALWAPLVWLFVMFALAGPLTLSGPAHPSATPGAPTGTGIQTYAAYDASMEVPDNDTDGSPRVLALPPKLHLVVNRAGTGTAPPAPVLVVLAAPIDRTEAGIGVVSADAGTAPPEAAPANSRWERAPPRAFA